MFASLSVAGSRWQRGYLANDAEDFAEILSTVPSSIVNDVEIASERVEIRADALSPVGLRCLASDTRSLQTRSSDQLIRYEPINC